MSNAPLLFLGILATIASSFWGLLLVPQLQIGRQEPVELKSGELYPAARPGLAQQGAEVYRASGCAECHTRQVRPRGFGTDYERGWGRRRTVAQDYLRDNPVLLGNLRLGPDLTNIGARQTNATWHLTHLYDPRLTSKDSMMPRYPFLFERRPMKPGQEPAPDALVLESGGQEIVPGPEATALVAYLLSLQAEVSLFEAPLPTTKTNATEAASSGDTNAPAAPAPVPK